MSKRVERTLHVLQQLITLWVLPATGEPKKIILESYSDGQIIIKINSIEKGHKKQAPFIDTSEYEKIDLRE